VLSEDSLRFYLDYRHRYARTAGAASAAEALVEEALKEGTFDIHAVTARAKEPLSLLKKLRQKAYDDPASQVTDQVGVRVITYYDDKVDAIVERLRQQLDVRDNEPEDKTGNLGLHEFGYRSVHLVVRAPIHDLAGSQAQGLKGLWFEIQVRSLLAHAWAEIEHEVVYKSGISLPQDLEREFSTLAAQLESADREFRRLRDARQALLEGCKNALLEGRELGAELDSIRLAAALEVFCPTGYSLREAFAAGSSLASNIGATCVEALAASAVRTVEDLRDRLEVETVERKLETYASLAGVPPGEVSHFAIAVIAAGSSDPAGFVKEFPDLLEDDILQQTLLTDEGETEYEEEEEEEEEGV